MTHIKIKNGHDFLFNKDINKTIKKMNVPSLIKLHPTDFRGIKPKLILKEGDSVFKGAPVYYCKNNPEILFSSPLAGRIEKINYGERRSIKSIEILTSQAQSNEYYTQLVDASTLVDPVEIVQVLCKAGLWPLIRSKPFSKIANPSIMPKSIFISTNPTAPFAPDLEFVLKDKIKDMQKGIDILYKIANCDIHLINKIDSDIFKNIENVLEHTCSGSHPSGNTGVHIFNIDPIKNKEEVVWYISPQALCLIGQLFLYKDIDFKKVISIAGDGFNKNQYCEIYYGAPIDNILSSNKSKDDYILISGDLLSGAKTSYSKALCFYDETLSSIKSKGDREFLGWIMPGIRKYTLTKAFLSSFININKYKFTSLKNGSIRSIVPIGNIEKYIPYNILITPLIKAILAKDIDTMEKLGIYECSPEDFSICTYVDASKMNISSIIQDGLDYMEIEG